MPRSRSRAPADGAPAALLRRVEALEARQAAALAFLASPPPAAAAAADAAAEAAACAFDTWADADLFRGRCDLGMESGVADAAACAAKCDAVARCDAFTLAGDTCYLKFCAASPVAPGATPPRRSPGATSGARRNATACARARGVAPGGLAAGPGADAWRRAHGRDTYETHARRWDHGAAYGPIVTIRGERHSGTNWLRVMVDKNCDVPHHLSERLDSDGAYGWKHDFVPDGFDGRSRDALVVVFRSAATWAPKMKAIAYNQDLDGRAKRLTLAQYVAAAFAERGRTYAGVLAMRDAKYKQYRDVLRRCPNAIGCVEFNRWFGWS